MPEAIHDLAVKLDLGPDAAAGEADETTRALREELAELGEDARLVDAGDVPTDAKGFGLVAVGGLIVKIATSDALGRVVGALRAWAARDAKRSAKLVVDGESIELTGVTSAQQQQLIDEWVRSVSRKVDG